MGCGLRPAHKPQGSDLYPPVDPLRASRNLETSERKRYPQTNWIDLHADRQRKEPGLTVSFAGETALLQTLGLETRPSGPARLPTLQPVVLIAIAGGSQRLVVEHDGPGCRFHLLAKIVQGVQLIRRGRNLQLTGLEEFLISAVHQPRDLPSQHLSRRSQQAHRRVPFRARRNLRSAPVPAHPVGPFDPVCTLGCRGNIKFLTTQRGQNFVKRWDRLRLYHDRCENPLRAASAPWAPAT